MVMYREVCSEGVQNKCPGGYGVEALCPRGDGYLDISHQ